MSDLTAFDIFFFAAVGLFALAGLKRGFVTEILGLLAWVGGIVAVNMSFDQGRDLALDFLGSPITAALLSVLVLFFGTFVILRVVARALGGRVRKSVVGPLDRLLGLGFGAVKGLLLAVLVWMLASLVFDIAPGARPDWLAEARSGPLLATFAGEVQDFVASRREARAEETGYTEEERDALDALFPAGEGTEI